MSRSAILTTRTTEPPAETTELRALADAAGYHVVDALTQVREEDPGTDLGRGKVEAVAARVRETDAETVVVDGGLTPRQTTNLRDLLPDGTAVVDRYRLVLDIFAEQAGTRRAQLQVELARLRYALPRIRESSDEQAMNRFTEAGTRYYDVQDRIDELERKLDDLPNPADHHRERRREEGFDLVTLAGYTNAGKSTLLHRLGDDLALGDVDPDHPDETPTAAVEDRLFKTLETTTRRATLADRPTLVTDTVGFVADLPHWLVESFSETLSEAGASDVVVLVADASDPPADLREKLDVSLSVLDAQDVDDDRVVTALNKVDLLDAGEREERVAVAREVAPEVVPVSVTEGDGVPVLREAIAARLPTETATLRLPNCDDAMSVVSWCHEHLDVRDVDYGGTVRLAVEGRPDIVERAIGKADAVEAPTADH
jgi:GTP-binding protein HflX